MSAATSSLIEKCVIGAALMAGLPLGFKLDTEVLGFKRYVWVGASFLGLANLLFVDPASDMAGYIDKASLSLLSVALVPHFIQLVKDQQWMALGMLPPFLMVTHASMGTPVEPGGSDEYWRHRAFLHLFVFLMPYLNHLPSAPPPPTTSGGTDELQEGVTIVDQNDADATESKPGSRKNNKKSAKPRTNKKKR